MRRKKHGVGANNVAYLKNATENEIKILITVLGVSEHDCVYHCFILWNCSTSQSKISVTAMLLSLPWNNHSKSRK